VEAVEANRPHDTSVAVVCGGTSGIGLATALRLADMGFQVVVFGRRPGPVAQATELLVARGSSEAMGVVADATDSAALIRAIGVVGERFGHVNSLVNAVGPTVVGAFDVLGDEDWARAFDEGTVSAVRVVRATLPYLRRAPWGRIVNVTAMSVQHQNPNLIAYTASKAALASVTKNLARTLAPDGILVNAVAPGSVMSSGVSAAVRAGGGDPSDPVGAYALLAEQFGAHIDLGRVAGPEEIAEVIAFCASRSTTFLTGAHINVDGGSDFV
jgi:3-oxoacyl-[acyl-carrier protein] reductase